jgi:DNA-binding transcriptional MerR regulator
MRAAHADADDRKRLSKEQQASSPHPLPSETTAGTTRAPQPTVAEPQASETREAHRPAPQATVRGVYHISIVAELVETHPQTLRMYERMGLISPQRTRNNIRLYSEADVEQVRRIQHLTQDLGVNLAGVEVVFKLLAEMERMQSESEARHSSMRQELQTLRDQLRALFGERGTHGHNGHA